MAGGKAFYDTNVLIAFLFKEQDRFEESREILAKHMSRASSIIALHEIYYYALKLGVVDKFLAIKSRLGELVKTEGITEDICYAASELRMKYKLPEIDSLILSTAISLHYPIFYTYDADFMKINGKRINNTLIKHLG